jgi:methionyl-tRNA formyltransferase
LHGSLLPRWRGAAPIERAIIAGENVSGVMVMKMNEGIDTGDIGLAAHIQITDQTTAEEVRQRLAKIGARLMARTMDDLEYHRFKRIRQDVIGESLAKKIEKSETRVDWNRSARKDISTEYRPLLGAKCQLAVGPSE